MKKLKYIVILSLLLVPIGFAQAANDVSTTADTNVVLSSPSMTLVLDSGASYSTMTVNAGTISITVSDTGSFTLTSNNRYVLANDQSAEIVCDSSKSYVTFSVTGSDQTIVFTPSASECSSGTSGSPPSSSSPGGSSPATTLEPEAETPDTSGASKTIAGSSGGSLSTSDSKAAVQVPAGLASGDIAAQITPGLSSGYTALGSGYSAVAGQTYEFSLTFEGSEITEFDNDVTLTFGYTDEDIADLDESTLQIYYWDPATSAWVLTGGTVDVANNSISVDVAHFTVFAVFGQETSISEEDAGSLIKLECPAGAGVNHSCKSVYYANDGKRYAFPDEKTYNSWYTDFSGVEAVSQEALSSYQLGGNVTMRPGTNLIKIMSDPKVYAVEPGGVLRWVDSEAAAMNLYGANWSSKVVDVLTTAFPDYDADTAVSNPLTDSSKHPIGSLIQYAGSGDIYYITAGNAKRAFSNWSAFTNNGLRSEFIIQTDVDYADGINITGLETVLTKTAS